MAGCATYVEKAMEVKDDDAWASLLPDHLLLDIFRRLETTAVIRCAGACKPWRRTIIGNASSLRPRQDRVNPNLLLGFFNYSWDEEDMDVIVSVTTADMGHCERLSSLIPAASSGGIDLSSSSFLVTSSGGFLLLRLRHGSNRRHHELCLCNAMARDCTFLPLPSTLEERNCELTLITGYDLSPPGARDDHGSVRILARAGTYSTCLTYQVLSCGGDGDGDSDSAMIWGPVQRSDEVYNGLSLRLYGMNAVVARDAVYWLAGPLLNGWVTTVTVGLDIYTGRAWATELPGQCKSFSDSTTTPYACTLTTSGNGRLSLLKLLPDHHIQVWVMVGDHQWTAQHMISIDMQIHQGRAIHGWPKSTVVCPRSGLLFMVSTFLQLRINLDSRALQPVQCTGMGDPYRHYDPFEMDWTTYISNMKKF